MRPVDCEAKARETADTARAALAFLRAVRDKNWPDADCLIKGIAWRDMREFAYGIAMHAIAGMDDESLDHSLRNVSEVELSGQLTERMHRIYD